MEDTGTGTDREKRYEDKRAKVMITVGILEMCLIKDGLWNSLHGCGSFFVPSNNDTKYFLLNSGRKLHGAAECSFSVGLTVRVTLSHYTESLYSMFRSKY